MKHTDFSIGKVFRCGDKRWRCTDVGTRVIVAICLDHDDDPSWYNGPPYAVAESVFDEYDIEGCAPDADEEATKTNTGETETTTDAAADDFGRILAAGGTHGDHRQSRGLRRIREIARRAATAKRALAGTDEEKAIMGKGWRRRQLLTPFCT